MVSFEIFVKSMPPSLSELKVSPSFCFPFKIPDDPTATIIYIFRKVPFIHHFIEKVDKFSNTAVTVLISTSLLLGEDIGTQENSLILNSFIFLCDLKLSDLPKINF